MKNKIALASAFVAASSFSTAEIVINDWLSFEGFVDMSYSYADTDIDTSVGPFSVSDSESNDSFAVDQVEISWLFDFDPVTAQIDIEYTDNDSDGDTTEVEQAFATYHFDNGGAITAGRYASMLGFEAFEPTGLYQYSFAYDLHTNLAFPVSSIAGFGGIGGTDVSIIPLYANGIKFTYNTDTVFFGISFQDEVFGNDAFSIGGDDAAGYGVEIAGSITGNGFTYFLGGAYEDFEGGDSYVINTYVTFETGAWLFAAEANYGENESDSFAVGAARFPLGVAAVGPLAGGLTGGALPLVDAIGAFIAPGLPGGTEEEVMQGLLMANFAYSDNASITGRVSYINHELDALIFNYEVEAFKYTLAHGYAFTDNLFLVTELSYIDGEIDGPSLGPISSSADFETLFGAVELIFSF